MKTYTLNEIKKKLEHFCVYRDRCHKEVEEKMRDFFLIPEAKELILLHLLEHNFLNEERFSRSFAQGKFRIKKWGKSRIIRELKHKDISEYNIKIALKEIDEEEYITTLYQLAKKKNNLITETNIYKRKRKLADFLKYRGFEFDLIYKVVDEITASN